MRFVVGSTGQITEPTFDETVAQLGSALPGVWQRSQSPLPVPPGDPGPTPLVKTLNETFDSYGRLIQYLGAPSPTTYLQAPTETASWGEVQVWQIYNLTGDTHPMHFHLVDVQVIKREKWAFDALGAPILPLQPIPGSDVPPDPNEVGYKETVRMNPGEVVTVAMRFEGPPGNIQESPRLKASYSISGGSEYVWHCHILEHEEHDMMHALVVV